MVAVTPLPNARRRLIDISFAEALEDDAESGGQRSDELVEAATYWRRAGDHERARRALLGAVDADDGTGFFDAKAAYAAYLMLRGLREHADELFAGLLHSHSTREETYLSAACAYAHDGRPRMAMRWANVGLQRLVPHGFPRDFAGGDPGYELLRFRRSLRQRLGEPADALDEVFDQALHRGHELSEHIRAVRRQAGAPAADTPDTA
ncbi:hypothetical protein HUO13_03375 [Saccharopolyspora erythraea]|nr:hypothetical protein HUO13_03375 [Saccharopolyspora erythraea]